VNIIHPSSLAYNATAYHKQQAAYGLQKNAKSADQTQAGVARGNELALASSSVEQIQSAIDVITPERNDVFGQNNSNHAQKAIDIYTQYRDQAMYIKLSQSYNGIDEYA
jgi:hypothetical protein